MNSSSTLPQTKPFPTPVAQVSRQGVAFAEKGTDGVTEILWHYGAYFRTWGALASVAILAIVTRVLF